MNSYERDRPWTAVDRYITDLLLKQDAGAGAALADSAAAGLEAINVSPPQGKAVFDVFQLPGTIAPNSSVTFTFNSTTGNFGAFACDNGTDAFALSSTGNPLTGPCTVGATDSLASFLSETDGTNTATIKFLGGAGFPTSWTFYTDKGNLAGIDLGGGTTGTPEPSSLVLLLAGALVVGLVSTKAKH